jgi:methyltransferase-like protein
MAEAMSGARYLEALGPAADQMVRQLSRDVIEYEQYLDFLRNRMFRRSLMCHADVQLDRNLDPKRLEGMYVASSAIPEGSVDPTTTDEVRFRIEGGALSTGAPLVKAAMSILGALWPKAIPFEELLSETEAKVANVVNVPRAELATALATNLAHSFIRQVVDLYVSPPKVLTAAGDHPRAAALARLQAAVQPHITTQLHTSAALNEFARKILMLTDGHRSRGDIVGELRQAFEKGELVMRNEAGQIIQPDDQALADALDKSLLELARMGFWC